MSDYTGKFGEGFKIASLCAYRDEKFTIHMESLGWSLDVTQTAGTIDKREVAFLAYDVKERKFEDNAVLILGNVKSDAYQIFLSEMNGFYYSGNPVLGKCIMCRDDCAVYYINEKALPKYHIGNGKLFARMQDRASITAVPLVFCNHQYQPDREDDRDRGSFSSIDKENAVMQVIKQLTGEALKEVFFAFKKYWNQFDTDESGGANWNGVIREMINMIKKDGELKREVSDALKDRYLADVIREDRNRYRLAIAWFRSSEFHDQKKLLPHYFGKLGIETLYSLCEKNDGFNVIGEPDRLQGAYIKILEEIARDIFGDLICYAHIPKCRVIVNSHAPNTGLANTWKAEQTCRNAMGLKVVSDVSAINLQKQLLSPAEFPQAMVVYMHELLHQFGGDASRQFHTAILAMDYRIIQKAVELEAYDTRWRRVGSA